MGQELEAVNTPDPMDVAPGAHTQSPNTEERGKGKAANPH